MGQTGDLRQIVYLSRATTPWSDAEVNAIGRVSRNNNAEHGITGLLLFDGSRFIQAIEGPHEAVEATMLRISRDTRHDALQIASDRMVPDRQFGTWSMQCRRTPAGTCSLPFLRKVKEVMLEVDQPALQALFIGFAVMGTRQHMEKAAAGADPTRPGASGA